MCSCYEFRMVTTVLRYGVKRHYPLEEESVAGLRRTRLAAGRIARFLSVRQTLFHACFLDSANTPVTSTTSYSTAFGTKRSSTTPEQPEYPRGSSDLFGPRPWASQWAVSGRRPVERNALQPSPHRGDFYCLERLRKESVHIMSLCHRVGVDRVHSSRLGRRAMTLQKSAQT